MKIKAIQDAWYQKKKVREGQIVNYKGNEVPVWGTLANGEVFEEEKENKDEGKDPATNPNGTAHENPDNTPDENADLNTKLEILRNLAVENDVWVDVKNMTAKEEIARLKEELKKKNVVGIDTL